MILTVTALQSPGYGTPFAYNFDSTDLRLPRFGTPLLYIVLASIALRPQGYEISFLYNLSS